MNKSVLRAVSISILPVRFIQKIKLKAEVLHPIKEVLQVKLEALSSLWKGKKAGTRRMRYPIDDLL